MSWFHKLERRLEPYAISNLTLYLVMGQAFVYLSAMIGLLDAGNFILVPDLVIHGEPWRILTFVFIPPSRSPYFIAFALYLFYLYGNSLEGHWGTVRYNLFLFTGTILTIGGAFLTPFAYTTNYFLGILVFQAFAYLYPEFVLNLFFILPVKAKWLGVLAWLTSVWMFFTGTWSTRFAIIAASTTFLIFFAHDLWLDIRQGRRRMQSQAQRFSEEKSEREPRHTCHVCAKTDLSNPELDFRYCSKCVGDQCYCPEHIRNHEHVLTDHPEAKS